MLQRLRHSLENAAPLLITGGALVLAATASGAILRLSGASRPASPALAAIGDGVDEFSLRLASFQTVLQRLAQESNLLTAIAVGATAVSVGAVLLHLLRVLRGSGDIMGFLAHLTDRTKLVGWGTVRDARDGRPLPLARVTLVSHDGHVIARSVADLGGQYGFGISVPGAAGSGTRLVVDKDGYYRSSGAPIPLHTVDDPRPVDVVLDPARLLPAHETAAGRMLYAAGGVAFWVAVATVPFVAVAAPNPLRITLAAGLGLALAARMAGLGHSHA